MDDKLEATDWLSLDSWRPFGEFGRPEL